MADYKNILLVVDLSEDSEIIGERARSIAERNAGEITLLHVVEYVPVEPMGEALLPTIQIETELVDRARDRLRELATKLGLASRPQLVETGGIIITNCDGHLDSRSLTTHGARPSGTVAMEVWS